MQLTQTQRKHSYGLACHGQDFLVLLSRSKLNEGGHIGSLIAFKFYLMCIWAQVLTVKQPSQSSSSIRLHYLEVQTRTCWENKFERFERLYQKYHPSECSQSLSKTTLPRKVSNSIKLQKGLLFTSSSPTPQRGCPHNVKHKSTFLTAFWETFSVSHSLTLKPNSNCWPLQDHPELQIFLVVALIFKLWLTQTYRTEILFSRNMWRLWIPTVIINETGTSLSELHRRYQLQTKALKQTCLLKDSFAFASSPSNIHVCPGFAWAGVNFLTSSWHRDVFWV